MTSAVEKRKLRQPVAYKDPVHIQKCMPPPIQTQTPIPLKLDYT